MILSQHALIEIDHFQIYLVGVKMKQVKLYFSRNMHIYGKYSKQQHFLLNVLPDLSD